LVFLSACHSGAFLSVVDEHVYKSQILMGGQKDLGFGKSASLHSRNNDDIEREDVGFGKSASLHSRNNDDIEREDVGFGKSASLHFRNNGVRDLPNSIENKQGYTSTALALLMAGVPQVVAMRYSVGDAYARQLAVLFYQHLLAEQYNADAALATARTQLVADPKIGAIEHTTPLLFGENRWLLEPMKKRNAVQLKQRYPERRFQPLLADEQYGFKARTHFVGRSRELTRLNHEWLSSRGSPVALLQGLAGLGKTALTAEVVNLWHNRFDWVLVVQARGYAVNAEAFYQQMDSLLVRLNKDYRQECQDDEYRKILLPKDEAGRYETMRENLLDVLVNYPILLIIDNFETNLLAEADAGYVCKDPEWTEILTALVTRLQGPSRVIITSRHRPSILCNSDLTGFGNLSGLNREKDSDSDLTAFGNLSGLNREKSVVWLALGPLAMNEAWLFLESHPGLNDLWHGDDRYLVEKVLEISHGHPLIMQRLGDLAHDAEALATALARLEEKGFKQLPDLVSGNDAAREEERRYLEDVAIGAVDVLLERLSLEGRQLLWVVTRALEPVPHLVLDKVRSGAMSLDMVRLLSYTTNPEALEQLKQRLSPAYLEELLERIKKIKNTPKPPAIGPLLKVLTESGLLQQEGRFEESVFSFHELVRERCTAWMEQHPKECGERDVKQIWQTYGEQYASLFEGALSSDKEAATEIGRRAITYLVRAEAFETLGGFASGVVNSTQNPQQLQAIITELETVAPQVPAGRTRWRMRGNLASALRNSGQPQLALPFYAQSANEAEAAENWADVAWICQSRAIALVRVGQLPEARETFQHAAQVYRKVGDAGVNIIGCELEVLRINIMLSGEVETVLPAIEQHLAQIRDWWQRHQQGETLTADADFLAHVFVSVLDIANETHRALEHWQDCLDLLTETEQVQQACGESEHALARARFNRYGPLIKLGRLDEAQLVLEGCLQVQTNVGDLTEQAKILTALANVWQERGDVLRAIELQRQSLAISERLLNPEDLAIYHGNLSIYLHTVGQIEKGARHRLAGMVYDIVTGNQQGLNQHLRNLAFDLQQAKEKGTTYPLPRLNELLQQPEFSTLRRWLAELGVEVGELQGRVDEVLKGI
jgi:tetratricopeptide (TPR) repeat protein